MNTDIYAIFILIGLVLGIVIFIFFMPQRKRHKYQNSPSLLVSHDYLNFKKMIAFWFIRLGYVVLACILTLSSIVMMFDASFFYALAVLIVGNIALRIMFEISTILFSIHSNLNALTDKITGRGTDDVADVSFGEFFGDVGGQLKKKQAEIRARTEYRQQPQEGAPQQGQPYYTQQQGQPYYQPQTPQQYAQPQTPPAPNYAPPSYTDPNAGLKPPPPPPQTDPNAGLKPPPPPPQ